MEPEIFEGLRVLDCLSYATDIRLMFLCSLLRLLAFLCEFFIGDRLDVTLDGGETAVFVTFSVERHPP